MPGVPPNAFAKLKQAFKDMLRPKKRQSRQDQQPDQKQEDQPDAATSRPDVPPKQLPPTHTGQHEEPLSAVSKPATGSVPVAASGGAVATDHLKRQSEDTAPVSPAEPTPVAKDGLRTSSDPVSAVSSDHDKPLPLPKTDGANDEVKPAAPLLSQPSTETAQPTTSENTNPASTTPITAPAPATAIQPAPKPASIIDEKMTVMAEEPPEIKTKAAAPGMSATSGPLDDFPMEGDKP